MYTAKENANFDRMCAAQTDRERILMSIAEFVANDLLYPNPDPLFCKGELDNQPKPGDLVQVLSWRQQNPWTFSWLEEIKSLGYDTEYTLRAVGTNLIASTANNSIRKLHYKLTRMNYNFLEGVEFLTQAKVRKAINKLDGYSHILHRIEFDGAVSWKCERPLTVVIRKRWEDLGYRIPITYNKKTTIKDITAQLLSGGYLDDSKFQELVR